MLAVLGLGSNRSLNSLDSLHILASACMELSGEFSDFRFSSVYRTKPMYVENQPDFYNMALSGEYKKSAHELLSKIHEIETRYGRNRNEEIRNGQRSLDIDIELFGNEEIHFSSPDDPMKNLEVPHPRIAERAFVLIPMLEVLPESAEILKRDFFEESLAKIGKQGAEICLSSSDFAKIIAETEHIYGRAGECRVTDSGKSGRY